MLDFTKVSSKEITLETLCTGLSSTDLAELTNEMLDQMLELLSTCQDADVTFAPSDPEAFDSVATNPEEVAIPWTLGHVIVHATASAEEAAFLAAEMARGVLRDGRSRYETHWILVTTIEQVRQRIEESRRIRLASLQIWPDPPHLEVQTEFGWMQGAVDAVVRFVIGLRHDESHLAQIEDIVAQAASARP